MQNGKKKVRALMLAKSSKIEDTKVDMLTNGM